MNKKLQGLLGVLLLGVLLVCVGCSSGSKSGKLEDGYYHEVVMSVNGVFIPKGRLSDSEASKVGMAYKVEMDKEHAGQVQKITAMYKGTTVRTTVWKTSEGLWNGVFASVVVTPQDNGYVQYAFYDAAGEKCAGFFGAHSIRFKTDEAAKRVTAAYLYNKDGENQIIDDSGRDADRKNSMAQLLFGYDADGRLSKVTAANQDGNPVKASSLDGGGATALQIEYDKGKQDRIASVTWINDGGSTVKGSQWAKETFSYDEAGRIIEKAHFGADGNPIDVKSSRGLDAIYSLTSPRGMLTGLAKAKKGMITGGAVTRYTYEKDATMPSSIGFYGKTGQSYGMEGSAIAQVDLAYDDAGNVSKFTTRGADGTPKAFFDNVDSVALSYDESGDIAKEVFYHGDNEASLKFGKFKSGSVAEIDYTYDGHGRVASETYFDAAGAPTDLKFYGAIPYHKTTFTWKDDGAFDQETRYNQEGDEIPKDALSLVYGKYERINPANDRERALLLEINQGQVIVSVDPSKLTATDASRVEPNRFSQNTTVKANINSETGRGTVSFLNDTCDFDAKSGTLTIPNGSQWKKIQ